MMKKRRKRDRNHFGLQAVTLCISTTLVLVLLGMVALSVLTAQNLSAYVKENLTVTLMLSEDMSTSQAQALCSDLSKRRYVSKLTYISKEQALREQTRVMGADPTEFLGVNPFVGSIELGLVGDYANSDSLEWIGRELTEEAMITDITYPQTLIDKVNYTLNKINLVLLLLAGLLIFVSYSLISSSVRLGVYARRFSIRTMKLVGASWGFIRRPFIYTFMCIGVVAAIMATLVLGAGIWLLYAYEPGVLVVITWKDMVVVAAVVMLFGIVITTMCAYFSVNKFLKMKASALYKI